MDTLHILKGTSVHEINQYIKEMLKTEWINFPCNTFGFNASSPSESHNWLIKRYLGDTEKPFSNLSIIIFRKQSTD